MRGILCQQSSWKFH